MTGFRQDAWSTDEDIMLAEIVLRHVREKSTQLAAFQEAADKLSRTAAACGFRWNACIRKKYEKAVELAKMRRSGNDEEEKEDVEDIKHPSAEESNQGVQEPVKRGAAENDEEGLKHQLQETISFLKGLSDVLEERGDNGEALAAKKEAMEAENKKLEAELERIKQEFMQLRQDYKALMDVMDKARALSEGSLSTLTEDNVEESS
ncbi:RsfA family transcriptional regulator [Salibacterium lacus]|uniref:RsfA family transcriptional regulator n=1 Tax=Salibacterium lacus TaxID=1898109 RepID=A0ABW5SYT9_9BACI